MGVFSKLFSVKSNTAEKEIQPKNFIDCLDIIRVWNANAKFHLDMDMEDSRLQTAMNTLVTCPYCSESFYFGDSLGFVDSQLTVQCPHCQTTPNESRNEYEVA
ncbi:MAG: hypothetical protein P8Y28_01710 [Gammaproteobacteria bacterium]|jgi:hypothetical protein